MKKNIFGKLYIDNNERDLLLWCENNKELIELLQNDVRLLEFYRRLSIKLSQNEFIATMHQIELNCINIPFDSENEEVHYEFEPIEKNSDLMEQNHWTIQDYYEKKIYEYSIKTKMNYDEAKKEFDILGGSLKEIVELLKVDFNNDTVDATKSIKTIISHQGWVTESMPKVRRLRNLLENVYLPNYNKVIKNNFVYEKRELVLKNMIASLLYEISRSYNEKAISDANSKDTVLKLH